MILFNFTNYYFLSNFKKKSDKNYALDGQFYRSVILPLESI